MEVILLSDVDKVGLRGEVVSVARGYARNYLLPRRLAEPATPGRVAELERIEAQRARRQAQTADEAKHVADVLGGAELRFDVKAGPTGSLFGSVTTTDIADRIWEQLKIRVDRKKIDTDSIRRIGRYSVPIQVFESVTAEVRTLVVPEGGELPPDEELAAKEAAEAAAAGDAPGEAQEQPKPEESVEAELSAEAPVEGADEPGEDEQPPATSTQEPAEGDPETVDAELAAEPGEDEQPA
jgi:large subunit ribosomal protein L9